MQNEPNQLPPEAAIGPAEAASPEDDIAAEGVEAEEVEAAALSTGDKGFEGSAQRINPLVLGLTIALVFVLGLSLGFFGRPVIIEDLPIEVVVTVVSNESQAVAQTAPQPTQAQSASEGSSGQSTMPGNGVETDAQAGQPTPTIMDFVLSDARHFQGDEAAPVTIIEFSDFN